MAEEEKGAQDKGGGVEDTDRGYVVAAVEVVVVVVVVGLSNSMGEEEDDVGVENMGCFFFYCC